MPTRTGRIYTGLSDTTAGSRLVSCGTSNCFLYKCVVEKGKLKKDQSQAVELRMQFRSKLANADHNYLR